jgi:hypothetical protein
VAVEESPHHSPTLRRFEVDQRQVGVLNGKEAEDVLVGKQRVGGSLRVFERIPTRALPATTSASAQSVPMRTSSSRLQRPRRPSGVMYATRCWPTKKSRAGGLGAYLPA